MRMTYRQDERLINKSSDGEGHPEGTLSPSSNSNEKALPHRCKERCAVMESHKEILPLVEEILCGIKPATDIYKIDIGI